MTLFVIKVICCLGSGFLTRFTAGTTAVVEGYGTVLVQFDKDVLITQKRQVVEGRDPSLLQTASAASEVSRYNLAKSSSTLCGHTVAHGQEACAFSGLPYNELDRDNNGLWEYYNDFQGFKSFKSPHEPEAYLYLAKMVEGGEQRWLFDNSWSTSKAAYVESSAVMSMQLGSATWYSNYGDWGTLADDSICAECFLGPNNCGLTVMNLKTGNDAWLDFKSDRGGCQPVDECPEDDAKDEPGACGCGLVDRDVDNNSVMDCLQASVSVNFNTSSVSYELENDGKLLYKNVGFYNGTVLDLELVALTDYEADRPEAMNGQSHGYGRINIKCGTSVDLRFRLLSSSTQDLIYVPPNTFFPLTFHDLDRGIGCQWRGTDGCSPSGDTSVQNDLACSHSIGSDLAGFCDCNGNWERDSDTEPWYACTDPKPSSCEVACGASQTHGHCVEYVKPMSPLLSYELEPNTTVDVTGSRNAGNLTFTASSRGKKDNNPTGELSDLQIQRSVTLVFIGRSQVDVRVGTANGGYESRNVLFSTNSVVP